MNTYSITYKLFGEWHEDTQEWDVEDGVMSVQATSEREATVKAQETIGLYVLTCQLDAEPTYCDVCNKDQWIAVCLNCGKKVCNEHTGDSIDGTDFCGFLCTVCSINKERQ